MRCVGSLRSVPAEQTRFANFALGLDATFCSVVGLVFTLTGAFMADALGVRGWVLTVFGVAVMFWSLVVTLYANRRVTRRPELDRVIAGNVAWCLASVAVLLLVDSLTDAGRLVVLAGLAIVAAFVVAQLLARRTLEAPIDQPGETHTETAP